MLRLNILTAFLIVLATFNFGSCNDQEDEQLTLKDLLGENNYDKRVRPSGVGGNGPTIVETNLYIRDLDFIDEQDNVYGLQITFRQKWHDKRLAYNSSNGLKLLTLLDVTQVWTPDLFFTNDIESRLHDLMKPNHYIRIYPSGDILYSSRISLTMSCPMNYRRFPFDTQECTLRMASYGYTDKDVLFDWKKSDPIQVPSSLIISKFSLEGFNPTKCDSTTNTGTYSCLKLEMTFSRLFRPYLINVYIPYIMMCIAAWLGTFLDKRAVTGRVLVAIVSLYVMCSQTSELKESLPTTAYTKSIDCWTGICITFVFATFLEFIVIDHLSKSEDDEGKIENDAKQNLVDSEQGLKGAATKWLVGKGKGSTSDKIDSVFRKIYPVTFALFVILYYICCNV